MVKYIDGVEIKIQAKKKESSDIRESLKEAALTNPNVKSATDIGPNRIFMDTDLSVSQQVIDKVVKEKGLMKSQFVVKKTRIRID